MPQEQRLHLDLLVVLQEQLEVLPSFDLVSLQVLLEQVNPIHDLLGLDR